MDDRSRDASWQRALRSPRPTSNVKAIRAQPVAGSGSTAAITAGLWRARGGGRSWMRSPESTGGNPGPLLAQGARRARDRFAVGEYKAVQPPRRAAATAFTLASAARWRASRSRLEHSNLSMISAKARRGVPGRPRRARTLADPLLARLRPDVDRVRACGALRGRSSLRVRALLRVPSTASSSRRPRSCAGSSIRVRDGRSRACSSPRTSSTRFSTATWPASTSLAGAAAPDRRVHHHLGRPDGPLPRQGLRAGARDARSSSWTTTRPVGRLGAEPELTEVADRARPVKTVAIVQSCYIPWKGYFDLIGLADEFILYDDRSTRRTTGEQRTGSRLRRAPSG